MSHPALEVEIVWEVATKIKRGGDSVSVFLKNVAKASLVGMSKPGLRCFCHKAGVRNWICCCCIHKDGHWYFEGKCLSFSVLLSHKGRLSTQPNLSLGTSNLGCRVLMYAEGGTNIFFNLSSLLHQATTCFAWGWSCLWSSPSSDTNKAECHSFLWLCILTRLLWLLNDPPLLIPWELFLCKIILFTCAVKVKSGSHFRELCEFITFFKTSQSLWIFLHGVNYFLG